MSFAIVFSTSISFAGFFSFEPKEVCESIPKGMDEVKKCQNLIASKKFNKDLAEKCLDISKLVKKRALYKYEYVSLCMEGIADKTNEISADHLKLCDKLISANQARAATICMMKDTSYVSVCSGPIKNGDLAKGVECLSAVELVAETKIPAPKVRECLTSPGTMKAVTGDSLVKCLLDLAPAGQSTGPTETATTGGSQR